MLWKKPKGLFVPSRTYLSWKGYAIEKEGNEELVEYLKDILTAKPRVHPDAPGKDNVPSFPVYRENSKKFYMPRAFGMDWMGAPTVDVVPEGADCPRLVFRGGLREEQLVPVRMFLEATQDPTKRGGIISVGCGMGKTVMGLYAACQLKKKTLIICHKDFLLNQWRERIEQFVPTARVGLIKAKTVDVADKDIIMASLQSLAMKEYAEDLFHDIGLVIADEAHHLSAEVFSQALPKVSAKIMLGLSATLNRKDGLRKVFEWYLGRPVYELKKRQDAQMIVRMMPFYDAHPDYGRERLLWNGKRNVPQMINAICSYKPRNELIMDTLADVLAKEPGRRTLILSDRRNHLKALDAMIQERGLGSVGYYVGGMKEEALKASEEKDILLATFSMAAEAMDVPCLNTLILASPVSSVEQPIGRIQRQKPHERKYVPLTLDIWDTFSVFQFQGTRRLEFYKKNGYMVEGVREEKEETIPRVYEFVEDD
jgi:superfamily II DNA or RNA helicase